jgi:hypothetical protein
VSTEIERKEEPMPRNQPTPMEILNASFILQAMTFGFLVSSQMMLNQRLRRLIKTVPVKEVVVVYRDAKELVE